MSDIAIDVEELEEFTRKLELFNRHSSDLMRGLMESFHRLGETWRDAAFDRYADDFIIFMGKLEGFIDESDAQLPSLRDRAARARAYLELR